LVFNICPWIFFLSFVSIQLNEMKQLIFLAVCLCLRFCVIAQTPVNLSAQPGYTYTENFADIANWAFSTSPANGTFTAGIGSAAWRGNDPVATGTVPDGVRITASTTVYQTGTSSGIYQQSQALVLLATGTTNNTTAVAMDLFLNFTGLNAGTLSFDWASLNNFSGDRKASLKVYYSTNGTTFTEIPAAAVLNITNNSPTNGHINFTALPAALNNSATAQLRFYFYNGTGGTTGSRPKISIDNIQVTGVPANVCATPSAQPTALNLSPAFSSISGSFNAAVPAANNYLVVKSLNSSLSSGPVDGLNYNVGDDLGDGNVISIGSSTSFNTTSLSPNTQYYFFVFSVNNLCSGGTKYLAASPLTATATTLSGSSPCTAPNAQATNLVFSNITTSSIKGSYTASIAPNADHYLVVRSTSSTLSGNPVNGTNYSAGFNLGGGVVVTKTQQTNFTANTLVSGVQYYFFVFAVSEDNCTGGPVYNTTSPLTGNATTVIIPACATPSAQPASLQLSANNNNITGYFTPAANVDGYIVLWSTNSTFTVAPQDGTNYSLGTIVGNATVLSNGTATSFIATGLTASTTYYFYIFSKNEQCTGGPKYLATAPLAGSATTSLAATYGYYYGNLHAHSAYSDGNKDNGSYTPANDYAFAKTALCMDFLGISEHNHNEAGMQLSNYANGLNQATAATTSNFLALYGMEWGVISNGGHVLVYGINQLLGWEAGNYNIFVAKSDYLGKPSTTGTTGLFKTVNDWPSVAFTMLAHPDNSDFGNIANSGLSPTADSAIAGAAIESGPAFSTSTTYNDPPSRLGHYAYYKKLLSRGYHAGPSIDHDNHYTTFGKTNYSRLAVLSPTLTQADLLQSIKNRRFYATHDCDTRVVFTVNNQPMGSIISGTTPPAISIYVTDPTNPGATPTIRLMQGIAGSGLLPVVIDSVVANTFNYTDFNLSTGVQGYYFVEISMGGGYVITSPVWYTKNNIVPVTLLSFTAKPTQHKEVQLNWATVNEYNSDRFIIEHSVDGVKFAVLDSVPGKNLLQENNYGYIHNHPVTGINYYRLKQLDKDGRSSYSNIATAKIGEGVKDIAVYPNPVKDILALSVVNGEAAKAVILITGVNGNVLQRSAMNLQQGQHEYFFNVSQLPAGTYFVVLQSAAGNRTERFIKY
jgi:hypothetical protein